MFYSEVQLMAVFRNRHQKTQMQGVGRLQKFQGAPAKFRKANIIFVISVRLSAPNYSSPTGRIFIKFYIYVFWKICRENSRFITI